MNVANWKTRIDRTTEAVKEEFGSLSEEEFNRQPSPSSWSIAQNIEHLIQVNESYTPILKAASDGSIELPWTARFGFLVRFFGNAIYKAVLPDRKKKMKTAGSWQPAEKRYDSGLIHRFEQHQKKLKELLENSRSALERDAIIYSPASRLIVYKLSKAFEIIITHEERHLEQAREVRRALP